MILEFSEEQKMLKKSAREFMEKEIIPIADEYDRKYQPLPRDIAINLMKKITPLGYIGALLPQEYGGHGLDFVSYGILIEELSRAYASLCLIVILQNEALLPSLLKDGTPEQKQKFIPKVLALEKICCLASTEPDVGSGARDIKTTAVPEGDYYILNGTKTWISNGDIADIAVVFAVTDRSKGAQGITCFIVDRAESPFTSRNLPHLGLRSCPTSELIFENCRVPKENILGGLGGGYRLALLDFLEIRIGMGMMATGLAQAALDASIKYAQERKQFGRLIGTFQLIQEMIADMAITTEAARFLCYQAYYRLGKGENCFKEASMAKAFATEMAIRVTSQAIQIHGAYGVSEEYPLERYFRDARMLTFADGTTEIQKLIVGREILGLPAFV